MVIVLLPLCYMLMVVLMRSYHDGWRRAAIEAMVLWGLLLTLITEALSVPHWLYKGPVTIAWLGAALVLGVMLFVLRRPRPSAGTQVSAPLTAPEKLMLTSIAGLVLITGIVSVIAPPNTWDAMEYHLPRAFFWMENGSVANYPTPDYAQLMFSPWAEFAMLHAFELFGSDRFVNCVEFVCYLASIVAVSLIAEQLGASRWEQILAAVVAATIPEAILEASGAMNTAVVTLWIVATVYFLLLARKEPFFWTIAMAGGSAALAVLSKGSAYVYLPPIALACWCLMSGPVRLKLLAYLPVLAAIVAVVNLGAFIRNIQLTGSPLGLPFAQGGPRLHWANDTFSVGGTIANVIRNITLHLGTPFAAINEAGEHAVRDLLRLIGQDPDDPSHTWVGSIGFHWPAMTRHELWAGNLLHLLVIGFAVTVLLWRWRDQRDRTVAFYVCGVIAAFLLFCGLLRYQIWASRHHLPLFCLMAAATGLLLPRYIGRRNAAGIAVAMVVTAIPFAMNNKLRSLVPGDPASALTHSRAELYFADHHADIVSANESLVATIRQSPCKTIGIDARVDIPDAELEKSVPGFFVYPILAMLHDSKPDASLRYIDVHNISQKFAAKLPYDPCVVICLDCKTAPGQLKQYQAWTATAIGNDVVFERSASDSQPIHSANQI